MAVRSIYILLMTMVFGTCSFPASGQSPYDPSFYPDAFLIRDHVEVFADRSIYVAEEYIQFRADHRMEGVDEGVPWSTVLYVELVASSGSVVSQGKFPLSEGMCSGTLHIPAGALTGNYYLKCYTRWMRNSGPHAFSYTPLKIVNPFISDVASHAGGIEIGQDITRREYVTGYLECKTQQPVYEKGEEVRINLSGPLTDRLTQIHCCVTVVPAGGIDMDQGQVTFYDGSMRLDDYRVNYLPDLKGVVLTGSVVSAGQGGQPIPSSRLYFSLLGEKPDYFATVTDAQGRFVISIPDRTGCLELFVAPYPSTGGGVEVRIDQEYDTERLPKMTEEFSLSTREHEVATRMALQMQLSALYNPERSEEASPPEPTCGAASLFYGTPVFSILMNDFITLPTLEEVFINLVPDVIVEVKRGRRSLKINDPNSAINIFPPLIMIDHLPVFDQQVVLGINPEKILKIDLINEVYVKGNVAHGGVISIFSRNGDMAGIDLSAHSYFFDFQAIQPSESREIPVYAPGDLVPDLRNTLLWIPDLVLEGESAQDITFKAPAYPGEYIVLVRGTNSPGEVLSATARFVVE